MRAALFDVESLVGDAQRGEERKEDGEEADGDVAVFDVDHAVDAEDGGAEEDGASQKALAVGRQRGGGALRGGGEGEKEPGFGVVGEVAEDADDAVVQDATISRRGFMWGLIWSFQ